MGDCIDHGRVGFGLGYATAKITRNGKTSTTTLHRKLYYEATGEWPEVVKHRCDNARCINLNHLEPGTHKCNALDKVARGRDRNGDPRGERNGRAVLSDAQVAEVRELYVAGSRELGCRALAQCYGVSTSQIHRIVRRKQRAEATPHET